MPFLILMSTIIKKETRYKQKIPITSHGIGIESFKQVKETLIFRSDSKSLAFFYYLFILAIIVTLQNQPKVACR